MLSWLGNVLFGGKSDENLASIPSGQLFLLDPHSSSNSDKRRLKFKDASLGIRRTSEPFHYQLVVSRVYEEGEEDLEDSNEIEDDEISMLIHESLMFKDVIGTLDSSGTENDVSLTWVDMDRSDRLKGFEFVLDTKQVGKDVWKSFQTVVYSCMYERLNKISCEEADETKLTQFQLQMKLLADTVDFSPRTTSVHASPSVNHRAATSQSPHEFKKQNKTTKSFSTQVEDEDNPFQVSSKPTKADNTSKHQPSFTTQIPEGEEITANSGQLYLYDIRVNQFVLLKEDILLKVVCSGPYIFWLLVVDKKSNDANAAPYLCQPIEASMMPVFNEEHHSYLWVWNDEKTGIPLYSWSVKFSDENEYESYKKIFGKAIYEACNKDTFAKVKTEDHNYLYNAYTEDAEMMDVDERNSEVDDESEEEDEEYQNQKLRSSNHQDDDDEMQEFKQEGASKNSQLAVGLSNNRSFIVRGNKIGVFKKADDEDDLKYVTSINNVGSVDGKYFSPRKVMLHEQDKSMLMMKPNDEHNIYKMDLEYGKVIEEWKVHDIIPVDDIVPDAKYAQRTPGQTLIGFNHNSLYRIDPRLAGDKLVDSERKQYSRNYQFSCASTTASGEVALANEKGEIRLYDKISKEAKTLFPGLGDPILAIDVSADGKWIVATCKTYLLLLNTEIRESGGIIGFKKRMPQDKRAAPKRLQLKPEHVAILGIPVSFTAAKFNTGEGDERTIVTSTGPYVIIWNFRRVKQGRLYDYSIKKYADDIVADNFLFGEDKSIIVTLPENVEMVNRSNLTTPAKMLKSKHSIVNSPF